MEDKAHRAMMEAAKLAEDLRMEQDNTQRCETDRKMLEAQVKDLQVPISYTERYAISCHTIRVHPSRL